MHVNSVEGRGWLGNRVDRCDGLSENIDGGHQPSGAILYLFWDSSPGFISSCVLPSSQSSPVQPC